MYYWSNSTNNKGMSFTLSHHYLHKAHDVNIGFHMTEGRIKKMPSATLDKVPRTCVSNRLTKKCNKYKIFPYLSVISNTLNDYVALLHSILTTSIMSRRQD